MLAKRETNGYKIRIVVDSMNDMRALVGAAGTGASTGGADMINVEVKKYHFRFLSFWETSAQNRIQASSLCISVERNALQIFPQLPDHVGL